ncbi:MAG: membrane protein insertase YidC [Thermoanaerobaculia bacterium]
MEKRLFIAVLLSIALLFAWGALLPKFFPELAKQKEAAQKASSTATQAPASGSAAPPSATAPPPGTTAPVTASSASSPAPVSATPQEAIQAAGPREATVKKPAYEARFSNRGGQLTTFLLHRYRDEEGDEVNLVKARAADRSDFPFAIITPDETLNRLVNGSLYQMSEEDSGGKHVITFQYAQPGVVKVTKKFTFGTAYPFDFSIRVEGISQPYRIVLGPGMRKLGQNEIENRFMASGNGVVQREDGSLKVVGREKAEAFQLFSGQPQFVGIEDNYFLAVFIPTKSGDAVFRAIDVPAPLEKSKKRRELYAGLNAVNGTVEGKAFFGPKEVELLQQYGLEKTLQFGIFGVIARVLLIALKWIYTFTGNYGWAIIFLTVVIKLLLYPLQHKSIVSMKKMQRIQPKVNALRDKFRKAKTDPQQKQRLNAEMMKLYSQEGINPMSGCFPMLLQLPILWAFYSLLSHAIAVRGEPFIFWIKDLSAKDPYYITPILMMVTMFVQQWMTPTTADPTQRRMFLFMPLIFGWIFKEFPSGLVLYWLVQNILTIAQQGIMNYYWKEHPESLPG